MDRRLDELRLRHPDYNFDVEYGYKPEGKQ